MQNRIALEKEITINLLWFSVLAEHRGKRTESVTLTSGTTAHDLVTYLAGAMPILEKYRPFIRIAVNQSYVDDDISLRDGDEIALITPVSGG